MVVGHFRWLLNPSKLNLIVPVCVIVGDTHDLKVVNGCIVCNVTKNYKSINTTSSTQTYMLLAILHKLPHMCSFRLQLRKNKMYYYANHFTGYTHVRLLPK